MINSRLRSPAWQSQETLLDTPTLAGLFQRVWPEAREIDFYAWSKRLLDVVISCVALVLLSPLFLIIAIAIKLDSPGPAIFVQRRVGYKGRVFNFYKFRSMVMNGDQDSAHRAFAQAYINGGRTTPDQQPLFKANGKRVTRVGKWIRKTSLDELPQLFNVLKGDMSLVGPRPAVEYEVEMYKSWHRRRLDALPGLTGLAQISGRSTLPFEVAVRLDLNYIRQRSLWYDIKIMLRTIPVVLSRKGAG